MDRKKDVMERLQRLDVMRQAVSNIPLEMERLTLAEGQQERYQELEKALQHARCWVQAVEGALQVLSPEERLVVDRLFIFPQKGNVQRLCQELCVEQSSVYRRRERALQKVGQALYGIR